MRKPVRILIGAIVALLLIGGVVGIFAASAPTTPDTYGAGHGISRQLEDADLAGSTIDPDTDTPEPPPAYEPTAGDWTLEVVVTEQQCFGSAGCNVTLHVEPTYTALSSPDDTVTYQMVYDVIGTDDALRGTLTVTAGEYSYSDHFVGTTGPNAKLTAKVVSFEPLY